MTPTDPPQDDEDEKDADDFDPNVCPDCGEGTFCPPDERCYCLFCGWIEDDDDGDE